MGSDVRGYYSDLQSPIPIEGAKFKTWLWEPFNRHQIPPEDHIGLVHFFLDAMHDFQSQLNDAIVARGNAFNYPNILAVDFHRRAETSGGQNEWRRCVVGKRNPSHQRRLRDARAKIRKRGGQSAAARSHRVKRENQPARVHRKCAITASATASGVSLGGK